MIWSLNICVFFGYFRVWRRQNSCTFSWCENSHKELPWCRLAEAVCARDGGSSITLQYFKVKRKADNPGEIFHIPWMSARAKLILSYFVNRKHSLLPVSNTLIENPRLYSADLLMIENNLSVQRLPLWIWIFYKKYYAIGILSPLQPCTEEHRVKLKSFGLFSITLSTKPMQMSVDD